MNGAVQTVSYEWFNGRWIATSGVVVNRGANQWSNFGGVPYRRRYIPIGATE